jgi:hypothetical protein
MIAIFPEIITCVAAGDLEELAVLVRRYFGGKQTFAPKPDVAELLRRAGIQIDRLPHDAHASLLAKDSGGKFRIVALIGTDGLDELTERFLLAHLFGHFLLDVQPLIARGDWQVSGYREASCPMQRYVAAATMPAVDALVAKELRADQFAAAVLLPKALVKRAYDKLQDLDKTAAFFGVSRGLLMRRLGDLGMIATAPGNFLDAEQALGMLTPKASPPVEESPRLAAPTEATMPRSYAASSYGSTARTTKAKAGGSPMPAPRAGDDGKAKADRSSTPATRAGDDAKAPAGDDGKREKGMDRLRELARKLDKGAKRP